MEINGLSSRLGTSCRAGEASTITTMETATYFDHSHHYEDTVAQKLSRELLLVAAGFAGIGTAALEAVRPENAWGTLGKVCIAASIAQQLALNAKRKPLN